MNKKEVFQDYLHGIVVLNLWHGVGCKTVEKKEDYGFLAERIAKKTIQNAEYYEKCQLFLVTSPLMERHFIEQCGVRKDRVIREGYPGCVYSGAAATFDHDFLTGRGLSSHTKIAVYAPTYRDFSATDFLGKALPDIPALIEALRRSGYVLVLKLHPKMMSDFYYLRILEMYRDEPRLVFWENSNDFYEVMDCVDLAIVDYSSMSRGRRF